MPTNKIPVPNTVGDFIKILQQFPADYNLDLFKVEYNDFGSDETSVYTLTIRAYDNSKSLDITCD